MTATSSTTPRKPKTLAKAKRSKTTPSKKEDAEAYRRSVACYPAPAGSDELMHAIPSWTQPVPRAGNWDDVCLFLTSPLLIGNSAAAGRFTRRSSQKGP